MNTNLTLCPYCKYPVVVTLNKLTNLWYARCTDLKCFCLHIEAYGTDEEKAYKNMIESYNNHKSLRTIKSPNTTSDILGNYKIPTQTPKKLVQKAKSFKKLENFLDKI